MMPQNSLRKQHSCPANKPRGSGLIDKLDFWPLWVKVINSTQNRTPNNTNMLLINCRSTPYAGLFTWPCPEKAKYLYYGAIQWTPALPFIKQLILPMAIRFLRTIRISPISKLPISD